MLGIDEHLARPEALSDFGEKSRLQPRAIHLEVEFERELLH